MRKRDNKFLGIAQWTLHDTSLGRLESEGQSQRHGCDHIDPEDLHRRDRQYVAERYSDYQHHGFRPVGRQDGHNALR